MNPFKNQKNLFVQVALLAVLVVGTGLFLGSSVFAGHVPPSLAGSDFEIDSDANLINDGLHGGSIDWVDVAEDREVDVASGSGDTAFGKGTKEDTAVPSPVTGSIPPNKSDLKTFGVFVEDNASGKFVHLFWTRVQDPKGTTNMDFEFNQSDVDSGNGVTPERTDGDLLIEYKLSKGGTVPVLFRYLWETGDVTKCVASSSLPCWGHKTDLTAAGDATGSINTTAIGSGDSDTLGALDAFTFGEATVDFSSIFDPSQCLSFGSAYLKSRSSDSFTAALKDYIAPQPVNITNCGQVIIRKVTDPTPNTTDSFGFTTTVVTDSANGSPFSLKDTESKPISNVLFGNDLTVTEVDPDSLGFELTGINCSASTNVTPNIDVPNRKITFDIDSADDVLDCTFTNSIKNHNFEVLKDFSDDNQDPVTVSLSCTDGTVIDDDTTAVDGGDPAHFRVLGFVGPDTGVTCTATESPIPDGYTSSGTCSATLDVPQCTIVNTLKTATFEVLKDFSDDNTDPVTVSLSCTDGTVVDVDTDAVDGGDPAHFTVNGFAGAESSVTCTATESAIPDGYTSTGTCSATLAEGRCTIVNTEQFVAIVLTCSAVPGKGMVVSTVRFDENDDNDLNDETPTLTTSSGDLLAEITAAGVAGPVADLLTASEYSSAALTDVLVAFICRDLGVGQARYEPLDAGTYDADVVIP